MILLQIGEEKFKAMLNNAVEEAVKQATLPVPQNPKARDGILPKEAAEIAGVSLGTIYNRVKDRTLTKYPVTSSTYRVSRKQVEEAFKLNQQ